MQPVIMRSVGVNPIFVGRVVEIETPLGPARLGVVDASRAGVAEGVSKLLVRSIQDARAENGGHLPSWLVDDIEQNYISPARVRSLWAETGHRFAMTLEERDEIVATVHVAKSADVILTVDRTRINVPAREHPGFKPEGFHHVVNLSVKHELRRARLGTHMIDAIAERFRDHFEGFGLWVRADPPWHAGLVGLGFVHDPRRDVFLPASAERTAGLPHAELNARYACACDGANDEARTARLRVEKLQYVSFTRAFEARRARNIVTSRRDSCERIARPATVGELASILAWASSEKKRVAIRGRGHGEPADARADVVVTTERLDSVDAPRAASIAVGAGATLESVVRRASERGLAPPVLTGFLAASVGGVLATGGFSKGSHARGLVIDHVRSLVVVTGDGRVVECSRAQAAWLFDAALGGRGFGVIAEATLDLAPHPIALHVERIDVDLDGVPDALDAPDAYHVAAFVSRGRALVIRAHPSSEGVAFLDYVAPRAPRPAPPVASQLVIARSKLENALRSLREATVHVVRRRGETRYVVSSPDAPKSTLDATQPLVPRAVSERVRAMLDPANVFT